MPDDVKYIKYKCEQCGAEDTDKRFLNEHVRPVINCHKCHAGFQQDIQTQLARRIGMFPVLTPSRKAA